MSKFSAVIAIVLASLALPALASADPTATQITSPGNPAFVTFDTDHPSTLHLTGTTSGGSGNVDLRCYFGTDGPVLASNVPVAGGAFSTDIAWWAGLVALALTWISGLDYFLAAPRVLRGQQPA